MMLYYDAICLKAVFGMLLDVKDLLSGKSDKLDFDVTLNESECTDFTGYTDGTGLAFPIRLSGFVKNSGGLITLFEKADLTLKTDCARCAEPTVYEFGLSLEKTVAGGEVSEDNDDYIFIKENKLDILTPFFEQFLLEKPSKVLCKEDCRGLCPRCGKNLNGGDCACPKNEGDPRLAVLKSLLKK